MNAKSSASMCAGRTALTLLAVLALGCDDDGHGSSGVPPTTEVQELTRAQLEQFCAWTNTLHERDRDLSDEQLCAYKALQEAPDDVLRCEDELDECLDKARDGDSPDPIWRRRNCDALSLGDIPDRCDATIGEVEACLGDLHDWEWERATFAACERADDEWDERPASCGRVFDRCKDLWR